jgi:hypothetical protein
LTEIYLCHACSDHEIEYGNGWAGHLPRWGLIYTPAAWLLCHLLRHVESPPNEYRIVCLISAYTYVPLLLLQEAHLMGFHTSAATWAAAASFSATEPSDNLESPWRSLGAWASSSLPIGQLMTVPALEDVGRRLWGARVLLYLLCTALAVQCYRTAEVASQELRRQHPSVQAAMQQQQRRRRRQQRRRGSGNSTTSGEVAASATTASELTEADHRPEAHSHDDNHKKEEEGEGGSEAEQEAGVGLHQGERGPEKPAGWGRKPDQQQPDQPDQQQQEEEEEEEEEEPLCRICMDGVSAEKELGSLISPCLCRGSMRWVHRACLDQWRHASANSRSVHECDNCK